MPCVHERSYDKGFYACCMNVDCFWYKAVTLFTFVSLALCVVHDRLYESAPLDRDCFKTETYQCEPSPGNAELNILSYKKADEGTTGSNCYNVSDSRNLA